MLAKSLILLAITSHNLALATLQGDAHFKRRLLSCVTPLQHHVGLVMADNGTVVTC